MKTELHKALVAAYLDWVNDYITIEVFASDYGVSPTEAADLLSIGQRLHEEAANSKSNKP